MNDHIYVSLSGFKVENINLYKVNPTTEVILVVIALNHHLPEDSFCILKSNEYIYLYVYKFIFSTLNPDIETYI